MNGSIFKGIISILAGTTLQFLSYLALLMFYVMATGPTLMLFYVIHGYGLSGSVTAGLNHPNDIPGFIGSAFWLLSAFLSGYATVKIDGTHRLANVFAVSVMVFTISLALSDADKYSVGLWATIVFQPFSCILGGWWANRKKVAAIGV